MKLAWIPLACIIVLHSPDGSQLRVETRNLTAVRAVPLGFKEQIAPGTKTIVYSAGAQKFGVIETPEEIAAMIEEECGQ